MTAMTKANLVISKQYNLCRFCAVGHLKYPNSRAPLDTAVLWIRIRMDPELLPGSGIKVPDPDPAKSERAYK